jgi:hypothetical protein
VIGFQPVNFTIPLSVSLAVAKSEGWRKKQKMSDVEEGFLVPGLLPWKGPPGERRTF